jgi:hypothetical protein
LAVHAPVDKQAEAEVIEPLQPFRLVAHASTRDVRKTVVVVAGLGTA